MLNPSSKLKGEKDWQKYETARKLHKIIDRIREDYWGDMKSKEMRVRQRAVAMYLIDKVCFPVPMLVFRCVVCTSLTWRFFSFG